MKQTKSLTFQPDDDDDDDNDDNDDDDNHEIFLKESHENLKCQDWDLNPRPSGYEAERVPYLTVTLDELYTR